MSNGPDITNYKSVAYRIAFFQFLVAVLIAAVLFAVDGLRMAYSALLGGLISASTTVYMGRKILSVPLLDEHQVLATLYVTELIKLVFTGTFFCLAFLVFKVHGAAFLGTYLATVLVYAVVLALPSSRQ